MHVEMATARLEEVVAKHLKPRRPRPSKSKKKDKPAGRETRYTSHDAETWLCDNHLCSAPPRDVLAVRLVSAVVLSAGIAGAILWSSTTSRAVDIHTCIDASGAKVLSTLACGPGGRVTDEGLLSPQANAPARPVAEAGAYIDSGYTPAAAAWPSSAPARRAAMPTAPLQQPIRMRRDPASPVESAQPMYRCENADGDIYLGVGGCAASLVDGVVTSRPRVVVTYDAIDRDTGRVVRSGVDPTSALPVYDDETGAYHDQTDASIQLQRHETAMPGRRRRVTTVVPDRPEDAGE